MRSLFILFLVASLAACKTQQKVVENYLEDVTDSTGQQPGFVMREPLIQKNDLLAIQVYSASIDPTVDAAYNLPAQPGAAAAGGTQQGIPVDAQGNIRFPRVGTIKAEGLTKAQLAEEIMRRLRETNQLTDPTAVVRFLNFRVIVLGEVNSPGVKSLPTENLTILEALGLSGDITQFGRKKAVKVLRQTDGKQEVGFIDVTSKDMFQSPYFQLQQNDVVMVEATRFKIRQTEQQRLTQQVGLATGIVTTLAILYSILRQ